ncbi:MAG: cytochrome-c peroxidase [Gemmataceae bacterium]
MRGRYGILGTVGLLLGLTVSGCAKASRYEAQPVRGGTQLVPVRLLPRAEDTPDASSTVPPYLIWMKATPTSQEPEVPIRFVSAVRHPEEWSRLDDFWNPITKAKPWPVFLGLPPLPAATLALALPVEQEVVIKVPLGLDDPTPYIPVHNPPTVGKWELGKRLFFDDGYLLPPEANTKLACATCHVPKEGFAGSLFRFSQKERFIATLLNCVYNQYQFWDGGVRDLEEVIQGSIEDTAPLRQTAPDRQHAWPGLVQRLREYPDYDYRRQFRQVFGTDPTQDAIAKALATYMRTILTGDALQDRVDQALRQRGAHEPTAADYEQQLAQTPLNRRRVLDLGHDPDDTSTLARELARGYRLFHGKGMCIQCHSGANYTDNFFHNVGVGDSGGEPLPGQESGRFATLSIGLKDPLMIGAYKTPTLRGLPRRSRYFHDGSRLELLLVVKHHDRDKTYSPYLDPLFRDPAHPHRPRNLGLNDPDARALVLFLYALDGQPVNRRVMERE